MQDNISLTTPVRYLKGVGPKKSELLDHVGIRTVEDLIYYLPSRYEDRATITKIRDLKTGESQTVKGEVVSTGDKITRGGVRVFEMVVTDGTGFLHAAWFRQPYLRDSFRTGMTVILYGKVERYDKVQIVQPDFEIVKEGVPLSVNMGRIVPVYPATSELTQKFLRAISFAAVSHYARAIVERLPASMMARLRLVDARFAAQAIHFPANFEALEKAYRRIVFEEFFLLQLALATRRKDLKTKEAGLSHKLGGGLAERFKRSIPFELTEGQKKAIADVERDMASGKPMNRLIEGDVGSGKTVVAASALALTVQNGFQGVIMAPTEILARQHYINLSEALMPLGVNVALLIGGLDEAARLELYGAIAQGAVDVVVGTHAIIQEGVAFRKLGLAVVDEQHKFGVEQRAILKQKGYSPHIMVMTATPIPRTLALTVYGDLDISIIRELPKGRKPIATYWVDEAKRERVYAFVREQLAKGRQAYVVCPLVEQGVISKGQGSRIKGQETGDMWRRAKDATEMFARMRREVFPEQPVALLHGRMSAAEKDAVMKDFKKGKTKILVATVVIEVGIDVPNATVMIVENAERFGLSQLHQLRGRIGRGSHESYCILIADPKSQTSRERLKAIEGTVDGFQIAEADLELRGPGEFFGTRQHGLPEIRFGNILKDHAIMEEARREAFDIVARDPELKEGTHRLLKAALASRFADRASLANVG